MNARTLEEVVDFTKKMLTTYGSLAPTLLLIGTTGGEAAPLPDAEEATKLSLLEALGYTVATEHRIGELRQLYFLGEGWSSTPTATHPALRPKHHPNRIEVVLVYHYDLLAGAKRMVLYEQVRNARGALTALRAVDADYETIESPPMEAVVRGFARGAARR